MNCKELRLVFVHHVNSVPKYLRLFEQVDTLHFYIIFISIIILLSLSGSVIKRPTDSTNSTMSGQTNGQMTTTSGQVDTTGGQTSTTSRQTNGQTSTIS